jgi:hypothetical protein
MMNFDEQDSLGIGSIEDLIDQLEREDERRRDVLRLPFECQFNGQDHGRNQEREGWFFKYLFLGIRAQLGLFISLHCNTRLENLLIII